MKKILFLLVIVLVACLTACGPSIPSIKDLKDFTFISINDDSNEVSIKLYEGTATELVIPTEYKNGKEIYKVVGIEKEAFKNNQSLKKITIPNTISNIGQGAFENCRQLETVIFEEGSTLTSLYYKCFYSCVSLTSIQLPTNIKEIYDAFNGCEKLKSVEIPEGVESIYGDAFRACTSLETISFPSTLKLIYKKAFTSCSALTTVSYNGTEAQWDEVTVYLDGNEVLFHITINFAQ